MEPYKLSSYELLVVILNCIVFTIVSLIYKDFIIEFGFYVYWHAVMFYIQLKSYEATIMYDDKSNIKSMIDCVNYQGINLK